MPIKRPDLSFLAHPAMRFACASLVPALILALGAVFGGLWAFLGFLWMTGFVFAGDQLARSLGITQPEMPRDAYSDRVVLTVGAAHFPFLAIVLFGLSGGTGLGVFGWLFTAMGAGLWCGQVSNSVAHELIHRTERAPFELGRWIYVSLLYGHHTSAHRLVHHRHVATPDDPNSAAFGVSFYEFLIRAVPGEFMAGYEMENSLRAAKTEGKPGIHPYVIYVGGGCLFLMVVAELFGLFGLLAYLLLCAHAQLQLFLSDYVQHYGLERKKAGPDAYEPFAPEHSWDAPDFLSGLMMMNAPRHADHHAHPGRSFGELQLSPEGKAPLLPASLPVMATIALVPSVWHRIMDSKISRMRRGTQA